MRILNHIILGCLLTSCGDPEPGDQFAPVEGEWEAELLSSDDGCELIGLEDGGIDTDIGVWITGLDDASRFEIDLYEVIRPEPWTCGLEGQDFTCAHPDATMFMDVSDIGVETSIKETDAVSGTFTSDTDGEVTTTLSMECEYGDCVKALNNVGGPIDASLPCASSLTFAVSAG